MSVRHDPPPGKNPGGPASPSALLSTRALLLLLLAIIAGLVALRWPAVGIAIAVGVAVLTLLNSTVGD